MKEYEQKSYRMEWKDWKVFTQFTHVVDDCEQCGKFPSLTDPEAEVYTVAELIARHERGLLTNLNIGKDTAYPEFASVNDRDLEKDLRLDPTDKFHLANELDEQLEPIRIKQREEKAKKDEEERKQKEDAAFLARAVAEGYVKGEPVKGEGV